jgi:hypothetical protein
MGKGGNGETVFRRVGNFICLMEKIYRLKSVIIES